MEKRLFRNEHDKMIAGVASGLAEYMQVDVTIIRLLFVISVPFLAGAGLIAYIIMWIIVPVNDDPTAKFSKFNDYFKNTNSPPFNAGQNNPNWTQPVDDMNTKTPFETQMNYKFNKPKDTGKTTVGLLLVVIGCFLLSLARTSSLVEYCLVLVFLTEESIFNFSKTRLVIKTVGTIS